MYCPGDYCLNKQKCESLGGYVTTPRSIYGCGKCGAWLFVHKFPFILQKYVKTTKTDKTLFLFVKKMNLLPDKQLFIEIRQQSLSSAPKKRKMSPKMEQTYPFLIGWWIEQHIHFSNHFIHIQSQINRLNLISQLTETYDLLSLQQRNLVPARFLYRLCYYCSKWSRPKYNNQLRKRTPAAW